jgi:thioesterase domain-containing protein
VQRQKTKNRGSELNKNQTDSLEKYLHAHIPLSATMQVSVCAASAESVVLSAPLEPNINHKSTVFGGSASAVAILSAWSLLHVRLEEEACRCEVVIQSNCMDYDRPISGTFMATSSLADPSDWAAFMRMLVRKKRARIEVHSTLTHNDAVAGRLKGSFVAFLRETS